jgi:hypothetical protein
MRLCPPAAALLAVLAAAPAARAADASFVASLDRDAVAPGEPFVYEVTLTVANEDVDGYRAPDFRGLRVLSAPQFPSRSTQMQIGGGQTLVQNGYTWRYELVLPSASKGPFTIGGAQVRVGGRDVRSNALSVRVGASSSPPRQQRGGSMFDPFSGLVPQPEPQAAAPVDSPNFLRAQAEKTRVYVGQQTTVGWRLYRARQNKFELSTEPRTEGFWTEEIPSTAPRGQPSFSQEMVGGRPYQVALLTKKALFPLRAGKLTVTPMEGEEAEVDFFGMAVRRRRLKSEPVTIEAVPLPTEGQPAGFDPANVGAFTLNARADRTHVQPGEAVTVTVEIRGTGNIRNVRPPAMPKLDGWKSYEPKASVELDAGETISGTKSVEVLYLPERPGVTTFPALELATFDPDSARYVEARSAPLQLEVTGEAAPVARAGAPTPAPGGGVENVIAPEIRPIRARAALSRNVGAAFVHSQGFVYAMLAPAAGLFLLVAFERIRDRVTEESRQARRRVRSMVRRRLAAAEAHREAGRAAAFYIEIDRVLREILSARLGRPVSGLRLDELGELLRARGMPVADTTRILDELEGCDRARFAPGEDAAGAAAMASSLERAGELIVSIEKLPAAAAEGARA